MTTSHGAGAGYGARFAQQRANASAALSRNARPTPELTWHAIDHYLGLKHSPEQIAGLIDISQEAINRHIYRDKKAGGCLHLSLRCQKPYRKRCSATGRKRRGRIANPRPVDKRTAPIGKRAPVGHWEFDAIVGSGYAGNSDILAIPSPFRNSSSNPGRSSQCRQLSCL